MSTEGARHSAVLYDSPEDLCARVVPYLHGALDRGEAVLVAVGADTEQTLRSALGAEGARVQWGDDGLDYGHLGTMFASYQQFLAERRAADVRTRVISENGTAERDRTAAYLRFEAMSNEVLGSYGYEWACLYDRRRYSDQELRQVEQTHPFLLGPSGRPGRSSAFLPPREYLTRHAESPAPVPDVVELDLTLAGADELAVLRPELASWAARRGTDVQGVLMAVGEVVTNALEHGGRTCRVRAWTARSAVQVRVDDPGSRPVPVDAGYRRPRTPTARGAGLWLARRLADVVHVASGPGGTAVDLRFPAHR